MLLVHNEIHYVPIGDGWEEVLVHNYYITYQYFIMYQKHNPFLGPKSLDFQGPTPSNAPRNDVAPLKIITYRAIKTTGILIVTSYSSEEMSSLPFPRGLGVNILEN